MKDVSWLDNPALKNLDARKLAIMIELINETEGKPLEKTLPMIMSANMKLKSQNLGFTPDETTLIFDILTAKMSPEEKTKFANLRNLMENKAKSFKNKNKK